ncbi:MAG TPA: sigma-54 dependent transcriptional regulator [Puia sp.]|nr:sigma-54 dependent transcriptional regulator [Puia sp.]
MTIIGSCPEFQKTIRLVRLVAPTNSTVLVLGETGTGKEIIARAIHGHSSRKERPMVILNCTTLPASLVESELFGHEKGSFTGAFERRIGKFEQAHGSTLFLDEISELPLELQSKLLRVLQEREIERIGCTHPVKVDVRLIAASNRNLETEVEAGRFRADLYYRLNVVPVNLQPLRNRREDIPLLVAHFIGTMADSLNRKVTSISEDCLSRLMTYRWPGNIRELAHVIERSIIMTAGQEIKEVYLPESNGMDLSPSGNKPALKTLRQNEREYILAVLNECKWKISGSGQAAEILGVPPSTLYSRMKKLGIAREFTFIRRFE